MLTDSFIFPGGKNFWNFLKDWAGGDFRRQHQMMAGDEEYPSVSTGTSFILQAVKSQIPFIWHTGKRGGKEVLLSAGLIPCLRNAARAPAEGKREAGQKYGIAEVCFLDELSGRLAELISCGGVGTLV